MGLIKVAEISIDKLEDRKTVTAILHENGYTVGPGKRKKTETGKQLDYYLKVYVEEGTDKAELYKASKGFTQEQVDEMIQSAVAELKPFDSDNAGFTVTVKGEGDNVTAVSCSAEDIQSVVDVLQMNADDGAKAVANVQSDSVLILLHALDTRATVKKAAQKQHDTLFSADGNSNESVGGNATTDSITEGADT